MRYVPKGIIQRCQNLLRRFSYWATRHNGGPNTEVCFQIGKIKFAEHKLSVDNNYSACYDVKLFTDSWRCSSGTLTIVQVAYIFRFFDVSLG